ncbi:unnamed protein product [Adineta ricciae]|uniref:EF-hand domain-containing protein n=1 Tax=Adineta ricciae TaxID=249248 RepID=A0A814LS54_ADIRI|nr:unnamed protein product [Adineta ricciae]CAF1125052.1 unnamed protein product [Adineta ricciae]
MGIAAGKGDGSAKKAKAKPAKKGKINTDGTVTLDELKAHSNRFKLGFTDEQVENMFKYCDKENTGRLSLDEVSWLLLLADSDAHKAGVRIRIVIPSTNSVNKPANSSEFNTRLASLQNLLCETFGGCTVYPARQSSYLAHNDELVQVATTSVETFSTKKKWSENEQTIRDTIKNKCTEWGQECVALEVNGVLEYITPSTSNTSDEVQTAESLLRQLAVRIQMAANVNDS